jgi:hypothetical protein
MKRNILILLCIGILLALPNLAVSDCLSFGRATGWYIQNENTIIFYSQMKPVAKVVLQDCTVSSSSNIQLLKTYMCDADSLIVDGKNCAILSVTSASSSTLGGW